MDNNFLFIKYLFFIIFLFPFLMHIYWGIFDILYANNIMYISFFLLIGIFIFNIYKNNITNDLPNTLKYIFIFYIAIQMINSVILLDIKDSLKYLSYILIFYFLFTKYMHKEYYIIFINIVTIFVIINLLFYVIALFDNYYINFNVNNLNLLTDNNSFVLRQDWNYTLPFYLSVIPSNSFAINQMGLFGLPRLFGMATEPTLYNVIILPTMFMSLYYKRYFSFLVLVIAFLLSSSFGAMAILLIATVFILFYRYKFFIFIIMFISFILMYYLNIFTYLSIISPRLAFYAHLFINLVNVKNIPFFATNLENIKIPSALLVQTLKYGIFVGISFLSLFILLVKSSIEANNKILFAFTITFILIVNKSGEILSPIFLFYISFLYTEINNINRKNNQKILVSTRNSSNKL